MWPCPLLYCTSKLFITLMPFQWCHPEVMLKQGLSVALWLAEAPLWIGQWRHDVAAGCHENGQAGEGLRSCPSHAMESISSPWGIAVFPRPASGEGTAMLTFTLERQHYSSQPLNEREEGEEEGWRRWRGFWGEKTEQSNISGPAIPE